MAEITSLDSHELYGSLNIVNIENHVLRPIIEIDLSKVNIGATGDGESETPYSINAK